MDSPKLLNPLVLAYQGDVVYELMVRRRLIETTRLGVSALHRETVKRVCAHYQSQAMEILEPMLTQEELEIYKRGRNASSHVPRHAQVLEYRRATGFEALFGYLSLSGQEQRLEKLFDAFWQPPQTPEKTK